MSCLSLILNMAHFFLIIPISRIVISFFFFFNDTATTEIYTLSLHDALPIYRHQEHPQEDLAHRTGDVVAHPDRKSTRLNSSHDQISYAVFCLKKKNKVRKASAHRLQHARKQGLLLTIGFLNCIAYPFISLLA